MLNVTRKLAGVIAGRYAHADGLMKKKLNVGIQNMQNKSDTTLLMKNDQNVTREKLSNADVIKTPNI